MPIQAERPKACGGYVFELHRGDIATRHRRLSESAVVMQGDVIITLKPEEIPLMPVTVAPLNVSEPTQ
jgi:hypothetical protein